MKRPKRTPNKLVVTSAAADPKNTIHGDWDSALINKVDSWVLSPNSARKIVKNVEPKTATDDRFLVGGSGFALRVSAIGSVDLRDKSGRLQGAESSFKGIEAKR